MSTKREEEERRKGRNRLQRRSERNERARQRQISEMERERPYWRSLSYRSRERILRKIRMEKAWEVAQQTGLRVYPPSVKRSADAFFIYLNRERFKAACKMKGISIQEFCRRAGVTPQQVYPHYLVKSRWPLHRIDALEEILEMPIKWFQLSGAPTIALVDDSGEHPGGGVYKYPPDNSAQSKRRPKT